MLKLNYHVNIERFFISLAYFRSIHRSCSMEKGVLTNFATFTGKNLCQSLFLNKVAGLRSATLLKKRLWRRCFLVNFAKFLRTPFLQNIFGRLLLPFDMSICCISIPLENVRKLYGEKWVNITKT